MSYSMSPPQKPAPSPYSPRPYSNATSPTTAGPYAPPAKRQRLSPDPRSPNGAPLFANQANGMGGYGNPYAPSPVQAPYSPVPYVGSPQGSFNAPQAYSPQPQQQPAWPAPSQPPTPGSRVNSPAPMTSTTQLMPPPPKPVKEEKIERMAPDDYTDVLTGSGVNVHEEENYVTNLWNNRHAAGDSFATTQSTSFGSGTISGHNSFQLLTQSSSGLSSGPDGAYAGTMGQPASQESIETEIRRKREHAARMINEYRQVHLHDQFLQGNCLRNRIDRQAYAHGAKIDVQGVYVRKDGDSQSQNVPSKTPQTPGPQSQVMINSAGTEGIVKAEIKADVMAGSKVDPGAAYEHIITLMSLASRERLRGLVEEAYGMARARQYGDHGRVPPEFADIAHGEGKQNKETVMPESITGSQWDRVSEPTTLSNGEYHTPHPVATVSYEGTFNSCLRNLAKRDREAEEARIKKRSARKRKVEDAPSSEVAPAADEALAAMPTDAGPPAKLPSKKELNRKKQEAPVTTEAQLFNQSNQTAAMMAMGKKNRYSWMNTNVPTNRFAKPAPGAAAVKMEASSASPVAATAKAPPSKEKAGPTWGDWREDSVDGRGIQLRDWIGVLERDGREGKALAKAFVKLR